MEHTTLQPVRRLVYSVQVAQLQTAQDHVQSVRVVQLERVRTRVIKIIITRRRRVTSVAPIQLPWRVQLLVHVPEL